VFRPKRKFEGKNGGNFFLKEAPMSFQNAGRGTYFLMLRSPCGKREACLTGETCWWRGKGKNPSKKKTQSERNIALAN